MSVVIPFFNNFSNFREEIILDEISFLFDFTFNERSEQWNMSVLNPDETPILYSIKLVLNYSLFDQFDYLPLPPGELYCIDTTNKVKEITRNNLGTIVEVVYITEAEL